MTAAAGLVMLAGSACAPIPPPEIVREVGRLGSSDAVELASKDAPAARAQADRLVAEAHQALADGDFAGAQLLAERARAAMQVVVYEGRRARALDRTVRADAERRASIAEIAKLDAENQGVSAEIEALQTRFESAGSSDDATVLEARSLAAERHRVFERTRFEAKLACLASQSLLGGRSSSTATDGWGQSLEKYEARLAKLDGEAARAGRSEGVSKATLHEATETSRLCYELLAELRAEGMTAKPSDGLVTELERAAFEVTDEAIGVVVRTGLAPAGPRLSADSKARLIELAALGARRGVPMVLVARTSSSADVLPAAAEATTTLREAAARGGLSEERVLGPLVARGVTPRVDPGGPYRAANDDLDVIFVTRRMR